MLQILASLTDVSMLVNYAPKTFIVQLSLMTIIMMIVIYNGHIFIVQAGRNKRGKYHCTINLLFDCFDKSLLQIKTKIVSHHTAVSKPVKQEVNSTVILPPLVIPCMYCKNMTIINDNHYYNCHE
jgi:hypothetical protein